MHTRSSLDIIIRHWLCGFSTVPTLVILKIHKQVISNMSEYEYLFFFKIMFLISVFLTTINISRETFTNYKKKKVSWHFRTLYLTSPLDLVQNYSCGTTSSLTCNMTAFQGRTREKFHGRFFFFLITWFGYKSYGKPARNAERILWPETLLQTRRNKIKPRSKLFLSPRFTFYV